MKNMMRPMHPITDFALRCACGAILLWCGGRLRLGLRLAIDKYERAIDEHYISAAVAARCRHRLAIDEYKMAMMDTAISIDAMNESRNGLLLRQALLIRAFETWMGKHMLCVCE